MNAAHKGRRREHQSIRLLEAAGYTVVRSAASKGPFDLVALGPQDIQLVQVKANRLPAPTERRALAAFPVPATVTKVCHIWVDHRRGGPRILPL